MFKKLFSVLTIVVALVVASVVRVSVAAQGVTLNLKAEDYPAVFQDKEPVKIVGMYVGKQRLESEKDLIVDENWLRDLRIVVKNVSDQGIRQILLYLNLPTGDPEIGIRQLWISYGRDYFHFGDEAKDYPTTAPDILLLPGETATITYNTNNPRNYASIEHLLRGEHGGLPPKGYIFLRTAVFEDINRMWDAPRFYVRNSKGEIKPDPERPWSLRPAGSKLQGMVRKVGTKSPITCWMPDHVSDTYPLCTACSTCRYVQEAWTGESTGIQKQQTSTQCYHTKAGNPALPDLNNPCVNCCQPWMWQSSFEACP